VYAKWDEPSRPIIDEYTVTFDAGLGEYGGATTQKTVGRKLAALPDPTPPAHHRFLGWFTSQTGGNRVTTSYPFNGDEENVTIYARYAEEFVIEFDANGGVVAETSRETFEGKLIDALPIPTAPAGYGFIGWYTQAEGGTRVSTATVFTASCKIYAQYESLEYTVSFDANGGTFAAGTTTATTVDGKLVALPDDPTPPENHRFLGWFTAQTGGNRVTTAFPFAGTQTEITLYAHYQREFVVTFNAGDGTVAETSRLTYEGVIQDALPVPTAPTGYEFEGWYTQAAGGNRVGTAYKFADDATVYAQYKLVEYIITFDAGDGSFEEEVKPVMTVDCLLTTLPTPTPPSENHVFLGWFADDGDQQIRITGNYKFHKDVHELTVYALYREEFIVTFDANGGTVAETSRRTDNGVLKDALPEPTAPEGFRFVGWFTAKTGGVQVSSSTEFDAAATVYARYEEIMPVVTVTLNDGSAIEVTAMTVVAPETAKYQYTLATGSKITASAGDVLTFLIDGAAPVKTSGRPTNHGVEIAGNKITVLSDGEFTFYLRYYEADGTNDPCWEVEMTDGKTDEFIIGDYYMVGSLNSWKCGAAYHLGTTSGSITRTLEAGTEFKIVKCLDATGAPDWDSVSFGYDKIGSGMGYADNQGGNIKIKKTGTYTITFADGGISISSSDVEEEKDIPYSVEVTFKNNVKVTLIFGMPTN
ncbi:MAG: InlB B-repeat-containing protein, partial [Clostridiales bacterium]|nr:InlB B-repeat-containing protein [Clostridiales bacterium]